MINLKKDKLITLHFGQEDMENEWLQVLENCPKIECLTIGIHIDESGYEAISKIKNLEYLQLGYSNDVLGRDCKPYDVINML